MTIEFRQDHSKKLAHSLQIRAHMLTTDISEAEGGDDAGLQ